MQKLLVIQNLALIVSKSIDSFCLPSLSCIEHSLEYGKNIKMSCHLLAHQDRYICYDMSQVCVDVCMIANIAWIKIGTFNITS